MNRNTKNKLKAVLYVVLGGLAVAALLYTYHGLYVGCNNGNTADCILLLGK